MRSAPELRDGAAPDVDGTGVPKTIPVTAAGFENNAATPATVSINVGPIIDAAAPTLAWVCNTPGAMYPTGATAKLQVTATPATGDSINAVSMTITDPSGVHSFAVTPPATAATGTTTRSPRSPPIPRDSARRRHDPRQQEGSLTIIAPGPDVFAFAAKAHHRRRRHDL